MDNRSNWTHRSRHHDHEPASWAARADALPSPGRRTLAMELPEAAGQAAPGRPIQAALAASALAPSALEPANGAAPAGSGAGSGAALPGEVRGKMEASFGTDFGDVRVHQGAHVSALGALAYTQGSDLHFAPGQYQPDSQRGQELIGHELAHVVQQRQGRVAATRQAKGVGINDDAGLEREADEQGARAARGQPAGASAAHAAGAPSRLVQCFVGTGIEIQAPIESIAHNLELTGATIAWVATMSTADALRQARVNVTAAADGAQFPLGRHAVTLRAGDRAIILDLVRRRVMERVREVRAPILTRLATAATPAARRTVQDELRTAARPFLDELRDRAQPGARFEHGDPEVVDQVLAALQLDGEGRAEDELVDQAAHGDAGPRDRARRTAHLPHGAWCGAFAYTQQHGAGLSADAQASMLFTGEHHSIDTFLSYANTSRVVWSGTRWLPVREYHAQRNSERQFTRLPTTPTDIRGDGTAAHPGLDIRPGDIVLIDNFRGTFADHITQCRTYDRATGQLETIGGNEGGGEGRVAASAHPRDLNQNPRAQTATGYNKPSRVYAFGRFSIVDYETHVYLRAMPANPLESPEAMAAHRHHHRR